MDENARLHVIFKQINAMLWECAEKPVNGNAALERRAERIGREAQEMGDVIAVYLEQQTAMMQKLIREARFSRFPLRRKRIPIRLQIRAHLELRRAIRAWLGGEPQDCERNPAQRGRRMKDR